MIDFLAPAHALLSENFRQHLEDLRSADSPALDQADHNPHMLHQRLWPRPAHGLGRTVTFPRLLARCFVSDRGRAALVKGLFLFLPAVGLIVRDTAPARLLPAVGLPAAKGTTQVLAPGVEHIFAPGIARIGEKKNAAVPASLQAPSQMRLGSQDRSHELVVLQDPQPDLRPAIPVPSKLKMLRDLYCKKPKLSLRMLTLKSMSSSYRIGARVSRRWGGDFLSGRVGRPDPARLLGKKNSALRRPAGGSI